MDPAKEGQDQDQDQGNRAGDMDEKSSRYDRYGPRHAVRGPYARPARRLRPLLIMTLMVLCCYYFVRPAAPFAILPQIPLSFAPSRDSDAQRLVTETKALVPFEAHIMSKCPDARDCLRTMVLPAMQRVIDKVNFTMSYIGTPTANDGVECMHGPEECTSSSSGRLKP